MQQGCDHASWISISKQNKYSPSLLLLLCSFHKPFQVPCCPFPHHDLYLHFLAAGLSHLLFSQRQLSFNPSFFAPFLPAFLQLSHFSQYQVGFFYYYYYFSSDTYLSITNFLSRCHHVCLRVCMSLTFSP